MSALQEVKGLTGNHRLWDMAEELDELREARSMSQWGQEIYDICEEKGFHEPIPRHVGDMAVRLLLIVSEICEAFEAVRVSDGAAHNEEIADTFIRLMHYAAYENVDADAEVAAKVEKNRERPYKHGKNF